MANWCRPREAWRAEGTALRSIPTELGLVGDKPFLSLSFRSSEKHKGPYVFGERMIPSNVERFLGIETL